MASDSITPYRPGGTDKVFYKYNGKRYTSREAAERARTEDRKNRQRATIASKPYQSVNAAEKRAGTTDAGKFDPARNRDHARYAQQVLKDAGYYTGAIDGIWGPKSIAANDAWNRDGRPASRPGTAGPAGESAGVPGSAGPVGGGGGVSPPPASPTGNIGDWKAQIREKYPSIAGLMDIPDLASKMEQAIREGWTPEKLAAEVQATNWWRTTPQKQRAWIGLYALDPATAERQIVDNTSNLKKLADAYLVPLADVTLREWSKKSLSGEVPEEAFLGYVKEQAKSLFPTLASAIDRGVTVATYVEPYRQVAAQMLEINPDAINMADSKWSRAISARTQNGEPQALSLAEWQDELRRNPMYGWDRTKQAQSQAAEFAERLAQTFGRVA